MPEPRLSELLRAVDWRFLLDGTERPRALVLDAEPDVAEAVALIAEPAGSGRADIVVLGFPTRRALRRAREALRPGGAVVCLWRRPRLGGARRARARLRRAGFGRADVHWPGPHPRRLPEFWLPLDSPAAASHVFAQRPPRSSAEAALRRLWRAAAALGLLVPLCATAALAPGHTAVGHQGGRGHGSAGTRARAGGLVDPGTPMLLLTHGECSTCTAVGVPVPEERAPDAVVKFSRLATSDASLAREAEILRRLEGDLPQLDGVPRAIGTSEVAGRLAGAQTAVPGRPLNSGLTREKLANLAPQVTASLIELASKPEPPDPEWRARLVEAPLEEFERRFGSATDTEALARARLELGRLPELPLVWEHRDCGIWNIVRDVDGTIGIHDWEFAEPRGLPALDLAFFLATAAFEADGVLADGAPDPRPIGESHLRLLDPASATGRVSAFCLAAYGSALGLEQPDLERLRLLSWIVQALADSDRSEAAGEPVSDSLRASVLAGFVTAESRYLRMKNYAAV